MYDELMKEGKGKTNHLQQAIRLATMKTEGR